MTAMKQGKEKEEASLVYGTCGKWLWLLRSRPDQVDHAAMRRGPPLRILPVKRVERVFISAIAQNHPGPHRISAI